MNKENGTTTKTPKALLISLIIRGEKYTFNPYESLNELKSLVETLGYNVVDKIIQKRDSPDPKYFIGKGKLEEIKSIIDREGIELVVFDQQPTIVQVRNLENALKTKVIGRIEVILNIFAQHAKTKEAKLQVELARLEFELSRLTGKGKELEQIRGGIGLRGPGETKLEMDRRYIKRRIYQIRKELKDVKRHKEMLAVNRSEEFVVALVGYTNAGKSSLMQALSKADVLIENKLFSTLDSLVRKVWLPNGKYILLVDTVGFIRNLPPQLVESFYTTLYEVKNANLLLHVVDISSYDPEEQINTVQKVLHEIGVKDKPMIYVFNKIDLIEDKNRIDYFLKKYTPSIEISAKEKINIEKLRELLMEYVEIFARK